MTVAKKLSKPIVWRDPALVTSVFEPGDEMLNGQVRYGVRGVVQHLCHKFSADAGICTDRS